MENETTTVSSATPTVTLVAKETLPQAGTLTSSDIKAWIEQTIIYSVAIPALLVFLTSIQNGVDIKAASLAGFYALVSAGINILLKYKSGV